MSVVLKDPSQNWQFTEKGKVREDELKRYEN